MNRVYVASKSEHGPMWQRWRRDLADHGVLNIISTWIDESAVDASDDLADLWVRCIGESNSADAVIAYHQRGEVWKGAFIEIGSALAAGTPVIVVGDPPGSWVEHPLVRRVATLQRAFELAAEGIPNYPQGSE